MSLARATLLHEWRRFLPGVLSVAFAGVMILVELGLLLGMLGTVPILVDSTDASLLVTSPEAESFEQARDIPASVAALVALHPGVQRVETLMVHDADWRLIGSKRVGVSLVGMQPRDDALACPRQMRAKLCSRLQEPMAVVLNRSDLRKLGAELGMLAEVNGKRVRVVGVTEGLRSFGSAYVFASSQTARVLNQPLSGGEDAATFLLAGLRPDAAPERIRDELQPLLKRSTYRVWTTDEFSRTSQIYWLFESGVGAGFLFSSLLGLIIGVVITSQTLRSVIFVSIREYATFRAIGVPSRTLGLVVLEQSFWIGLLGAFLALVLSALANLLAHIFDVALTLTWWAAVLAVVISMVTATLSGLLALRELYRLEPAELLR